MLIGRVQDSSTFLQLLELLTEYEHTLPNDLRHGPEPNLACVRQEYDEPNAAFVALIRDAAEGCVAVKRHDDSTAIIQRLYVRPAYRGHGLGRALLAAVLGFCRERGYERVALDTEQDRLPTAYRLYASLGFTNCEPYGSVTYENPTFMELRLT